jgi:hypothetical protein
MLNRRNFPLVSILLLALVPSLAPQDTAPAPSQIATAKKVFVSNAGSDAIAADSLRRAGDPNLPYSRLVAALKSWGKYELVTSPADADLVFELRFSAPFTNPAQSSRYKPILELTILDARSHFKLWTVTQPVEGAFRKATFIRNVGEGVNGVVVELKKLS